MLSEEDHAWLKERNFTYETSLDPSGLTNLIIKGYRLPDGFDHEDVDLLVRLPSGFPDAAPDMFWVDPTIKLRKTGATAPASEQYEKHAGRNWQRFSRHLNPGAWRPGVDSLQSWIIAIRVLLEKDINS